MTKPQPQKSTARRGKAPAQSSGSNGGARDDAASADVIRVLCHVLLSRWADRHGTSINPREMADLFADWSEEDAGRVERALQSIGLPAKLPAKPPVRQAPAPAPVQADIPAGAKPILRAAAEVFLEFGYGASLDQIAVAADVTKPTIYSYYKDKNELFRAAMLDVTEKITPRIDPPDVTGDLKQELMRYAVSFRGLILSERMLQIYRTALINLRDMPDIGSLLARKTMVQTNLSLKTFFIEAIEAGRIRPVDPDILSEFFFAAASGQSRTRLLMGLPADPCETGELYLSTVVDCFLHGVLLEPQPAPPARKRNGR